MADARRLVVAVAVAGAVALPLGLLGCGADESAAPTGPGGTPSAADQASDDGVERAYPDIVAAELVLAGDGLYDLEVTVSSPYDAPKRYADGWRVLAPDGSVLGEHQLLHDHASEQPFTRTRRGLAIPAGVVEVVVEGRDLLNGYGGTTLVVPVPTRPAG